MRRIEKVSSYQITLLIIVYKLVVTFSYIPALDSPPGNQDVWMAVLLSIPYVILFCVPILFLSNRFNNYTIIEYMELMFGKFFGKIVGLFYSGVFVIFSIAFVSILVEILDSIFFPEVPTIVTASMMIASCAYIAYKGLEPIARGAEIFVPFILSVILIFPILGYKNMDFSVFLPILKDSSFIQLNKGAMYFALRFSDILILAMIVPNLEKRNELNKIFLKSLFYSTLFVVVIVVASQAALGIEQAKHSNFPFFSFTRLINILDFIQRIESIFVVAWITSNIGKIAGYLYFSAKSLSQVMNKEDNKKFIVPIALLIMFVSVFIKNRHSVVGTREPLQKILLIITLISVIVVPLIALVIYFLRRKHFQNEKSK
jgi:spore germination protein KB